MSNWQFWLLMFSLWYSTTNQVHYAIHKIYFTIAMTVLSFIALLMSLASL